MNFCGKDMEKENRKHKEAAYQKQGVIIKVHAIFLRADSSEWRAWGSRKQQREMMMERKVRARWLMTKFIILWSMNSILGSRTPLIFCKKESNMIRFVFSITFCVTVFVYVTILSSMYNTTFSSQAKICCTSCGFASTGTMLGTLQQFNRTYFFFFFLLHKQCKIPRDILSINWRTFLLLLNLLSFAGYSI